MSVGLAITALGGCRGEQAELSADLELEEVARFGSRDGSLAFQAIQHLAADPSGEHVYITQRGVSSLLVLSRSGDSIRSIGRPGDGPGEFRFPGAAHVWRDTLWVPDYAGRVTAFGSSGQYLADISLLQVRLPGSTAAPSVMGVLEDGSLLIEEGINMGRATAGEQTVASLARIDRSGNLLSALGRRVIEGGFARLSLGVGRVLVGPHPTPTWDLTCLDPFGRWLVTAAQEVGGPTEPTVRLSWIRPDGDTIQSVTVPIPAVGIRDAQTAWKDDFASSFQLSDAQVQEVVESLTWPTYAPATTLVCDHLGRSWLQVPHANPDSATWMVHGPDGEFIGATTLPAQVRLTAAVRDDVWGWATGDYDEPYVLRFRLTGQGGGGRSAVP